jgi:hypothetical protein
MCLKKKKKKGKRTLPPFRPSGPPKPSRSGACLRLFFFFPRGCRHPGPTCQPPFSFPSPSFLCSAWVARHCNPRRARLPPFLFPSARASQLRQLNATFNPRLFPPSLYSLHAGQSAGYLWQAAGRRVLSFPLLFPFISI